MFLWYVNAATEFCAFKYLSGVPITLEVGSVLILSLMLSWTKLLKSVGGKLDTNFLIYSFVKSNLNGMYPDLRAGMGMELNGMYPDFTLTF